MIKYIIFNEDIMYIIYIPSYIIYIIYNNILFVIYFVIKDNSYWGLGIGDWGIINVRKW